MGGYAHLGPVSAFNRRSDVRRPRPAWLAVCLAVLTLVIVVGCDAASSSPGPSPSLVNVDFSPLPSVALPSPLPTKTLSPKDVLRFRDYAFNAYFRNPAYLDMMEKKFGKRARKHIEEMAAHDLKRKLFEGDMVTVAV